MAGIADYATPLWPMIVYFMAVILLVAAMLALSYALGQKHRERSTGEPYESGMVPTGPARLRFDVQFYMVAMFFVIFDIEAVFIFAWSVVVREVGWAGYIEISLFIAVLAVALAYLWRQGALNWGRSNRTGDKILLTGTER